MVLSWIKALLMTQRPYLLHWRIAREDHYRIYTGLWEAIAVATLTLAQDYVEDMTLTDRNVRPVPIPAHSIVTWRWSGNEHSEIFRSRGESMRRIHSLARNRAVEFVRLVRPDGKILLTPEGFQNMRRIQGSDSPALPCFWL